MQLCYLAGQALGMFVWGRFIFRPGGEGVTAGLGFQVSAGVLVIVVVWYAWLMHSTGVLRQDGESSGNTIESAVEPLLIKSNSGGPRDKQHSMLSSQS
jgi:hypothetical protein